MCAEFSWKKWQEGDPLTINRIVWDSDEFDAVKEVFERDWFGPSLACAEFEGMLAAKIGTKYAQAVNSGSSALLLGAKALQYQDKWEPGDYILHPVCTFPTSCNPIWQTGMVPVFVDVEEGTYNIDLNYVEDALKTYPNIKGAIIPYLLGNMCEVDRLLELLDGRPLIEDCCDTMGSAYDGKMLGSFGDVAAFSSYASHHISTLGVGGAMLTNDEVLHRLVKSMAFWGRQFVTTDDPYYDFTQRYTYETLGYDMQMTEAQAAFGVAQMGKLDDWNLRRNVQFDKTYEFISQWRDWVVMPKSPKKAQPSWFGFPMSIKPEAPFTREDIARHLLASKIEIRPLFAGNLTKQLAYKSMPFVMASPAEQANNNMERAFFIPSWGGMSEGATQYLFDSIRAFMEKY